MKYSEEQIRIANIFFRHSTRKLLEVEEKNTRVVHYTSAEAAISIIRNKEVWMRKSTIMNDFMEIEHGSECLIAAYRGDAGTKFKALLEQTHPGLATEIEQRFDGWMPFFRTDTYLVSISEHLTSEDAIGRLSMWRAYGANNGVGRRCELNRFPVGI